MNDGGPAFPLQELDAQGNPMEGMWCGMSLRDYFAAQALASIMVAADYSSGPCNASCAERAYALADAMITEREKGTLPCPR